MQVGTIGLIKAIDRLDISRGWPSPPSPCRTSAAKSCAASATPAGTSTSLRLQELRVELAKAKEHLATRLDRDPTLDELAAHLKRSEGEVRDGLIAAAGVQRNLPGQPQP